MTANVAPRQNLTRFAWLSIAAALATIALKAGAYFVTGSVGLLSDAAESVVNLAAAIVALIVLHIAAQPHDEKHHFGHSKAEYFAAAAEGQMIFIAALFIIWAAVDRLLHPATIENVGPGLVISVAASVLNGVVAMVLMRAGKRHRSITLVADGKHLLTDVWTSVGVVVGVLLVAITGWERLDPIVALLVGANIVWTGWKLIQQSFQGLMDHALSDEQHDRLVAILAEFEAPEVRFHQVRTREAGHRAFISMHVLLPGAWSVQQAHDFVERLEHRIAEDFEDAEIFTHLEPIEDPLAYEGGYAGLPVRNHENLPPGM